MKRAVRIIIPICITLAILFCMAWYLLIYDRDFTRDVLLSSARFFENQGNHAISVWLYDLAYNQAEHNDDVAIELAQQYIDTGNYSRAEYTLSNAIADGGGIDLYVALCRIYVEQDKLLDAVNFLNKVSDPAIKAQLSQMRPAAPTVSPEPGIYNQYFSVTVNAELGTLYVTTDREYPSLEEDRYTGPIALNAGENTLFALAVAPNGLVSELAITVIPWAVSSKKSSSKMLPWKPRSVSSWVWLPIWCSLPTNSGTSRNLQSLQKQRIIRI